MFQDQLASALVQLGRTSQRKETHRYAMINAQATSTMTFLQPLVYPLAQPGRKLRMQRPASIIVQMARNGTFQLKLAFHLAFIGKKVLIQEHALIDVIPRSYHCGTNQVQLASPLVKFGKLLCRIQLFRPMLLVKISAVHQTVCGTFPDQCAKPLVVSGRMS